MTPVWELEGIVKRYRSGPIWNRKTTEAVRDVSLSVGMGERVGLIGESGAGKSTLVRAGLGLVRSDAGDVRLFGASTREWSHRQWRESRARAQILFQDPRSMLNPYLPIGWTLEESAGLYQRDRPAREAVGAVLRAVGLAGHGSRRPHELSGGELRRAGIARLLLARPRLCIADEPTAGLDAPLKASLVELLLQRLGPECAVVLISHDLPLVLWACHRVLVMRAGAMVDAFEVQGLRPAERHPYTQELLAASGWRW